MFESCLRNTSSPKGLLFLFTINFLDVRSYCLCPYLISCGVQVQSVFADFLAHLLGVWFFEFAEDSVRCGKKGNIYFGLGQIETDMLPHFDYYLFSDSGAKTTKDSLWILETDSTKYLDCEKLEISNMNLMGTFCLKKFDGNVKRERASKNYFIYSKYGSYKAFCDVDAYDCVLRYSCVIQYNGTFNFSKIPDADAAERIQIGCII